MHTDKLNLNGGTYTGGGYFTTYTQRKINPINPDPDSIAIEDIAHALSQICRWGGHCNHFYSVAQHSVFVSQVCNPEDALDGLLHDASEAYLSDIVRPVKYTEKMEGYREVEANLEYIISLKFGLKYPMVPSVKYADDVVLLAESQVLFTPIPQWSIDVTFEKYNGKLPFHIRPADAGWAPKAAEMVFLERFKQLTKENNA